MFSLYHATHRRELCSQSGASLNEVSALAIYLFCRETKWFVSEKKYKQRGICEVDRAVATRGSSLLPPSFCPDHALLHPIPPLLSPLPRSLSLFPPSLLRASLKTFIINGPSQIPLPVSPPRQGMLSRLDQRAPVYQAYKYSPKIQSMDLIHSHAIHQNWPVSFWIY